MNTRTIIELLHHAFSRQPFGEFWLALTVFLAINTIISNHIHKMKQRRKKRQAGLLSALTPAQRGAVRTSVQAAAWEAGIVLALPDGLLRAAAHSGQVLHTMAGMCGADGPVDLAALRESRAQRLGGLRQLTARIDDGQDDLRDAAPLLATCIQEGISEARLMLALPAHMLESYPLQAVEVSVALGLDVPAHHQPGPEGVEAYFRGRIVLLEEVAEAWGA